MATCDCSGASRAYVIVNPNSVNRREILSLNPPICHDVKTKGLLINGSPWTAPKEIQSWETEQLPTGPLLVANGMFSYNAALQQPICLQSTNAPDINVFHPSLFSQSGISNTTGLQTLSEGFSLENTRGGAASGHSGTVNCRKFHKHNCNWGEISFNGGPFRQLGSGRLYYSSPGNCILTITYTDNTTQELIYDECPAVEPLQCLEITDQGAY
ncbi:MULTISPECIES: hypothetical protein [Cyanophyceae]|uniref:hypothetical protein n=1 Tax=Cyanophyceae TaxID=3028117 RepID=UPI00016DC979|nr:MULTISPECIES: hypothetical protein [Cyanophyceae]ACA99857.1 Hypothetical protein SYNPCC7002_A1869 [Picosynechococcus sp. PCC 7002]SMH55164.1 hypothetical protein SAMN06272755_2923 [Picosynechococcus sp. OG1]SMQ83178.1 hypothetical protein SAMN06272774_2199 [Synechococcus sp. 7002]